MAPEQIEKPQTVDRRADIYSLGVVFYEMLTGELPLGNFQPPSQKVQIDVRLDQVVLHALEKEPERRYQAAGEVKTAVETIANSTPPPPDAAAVRPPYLEEEYTLGIDSCLRRGWSLVWADFWPVIVVTLLMLCLRAAAMTVVVGVVVSGPLMGGLYYYLLKKIRGEPAGVGTAFAGFGPAFLPLFLASILMGVFTFLGFMCFVLPGLYLLVGWSFTLVLIVDKQLGFWPAMGLSRKMISKHWWRFFGFLIVLALINLVGMMLFMVGCLITVPVTLAALLFAYEDIFGAQRPAAVPPLAAAAPSVPPSGQRFGWAFAGVLITLIVLLFIGVGLKHRRHRLLNKNNTVVAVSATNSVLGTNEIETPGQTLAATNAENSVADSADVENHSSAEAGQPAMNSRQQTLHERFVARTTQDQANYTPEQLRDAEQLYQVANQKRGTPEAKESLQTMIQKYPGLNRTGCAVLYLAQMTQGDERTGYLQDSIQKYNDCFYGDGVQVGAYARFLLLQDYQSQGDSEKAKALFDEIKAEYADAIDHQGNFLVNSIEVGGFEKLLNADQRTVSNYINHKFARFADERNFDSWSAGDRKSLEKRMLDTLNGPPADDYFQAINTLAALHSTNALPHLRKLAFEHRDTLVKLEKSNRPRWMAIRALGVMGDKLAVPGMIHLLYHNNSYVRWSAQIALVRLTGQNFGSDWRAWGKWVSSQRGYPPFNPEPVRWWRGQAEPDQLANDLAEADQRFLDNIKGIKPEAAPANALIKSMAE
jgi:hypothetical protein